MPCGRMARWRLRFQKLSRKDVYVANAMKNESDEFFLKQIKLQKQRLLVFLPAALFFYVSFYGRIQHMKSQPWFLLAFAILYLFYGLVWLPLRNASITSKTIRSYTLGNDGSVQLCFFNYLYFPSHPKTVLLRDYKYVDRQSEGKKNIFGLSPSVEIRNVATGKKFFYFPACFENECELHPAFNLSVDPLTGN